MTYTFSIFADKEAKEPENFRKPWQGIAAGLTKFTERPDKDGRLWSPTLYRDGTKRGNANVESISCLVLDFDSGFDPLDFANSWDGLTFVIHSTHGTTPEHPKWRAVFPLSAPVIAGDWPKVHAKLAEHLSRGAADPSCKDAARMYYLPSHPPGVQPFCFAHEGVLLDPNSIPDPQPEASEPARPSSESTAGKRPGDDFDNRATWPDILEPHKWKLCRQGYGGMDLWTRPGKASGISARTGLGTEGDRFWCWSSEAGVPCHKLLTKFSLFAHLNHQGNFKEAAKALAATGYGEQQERRSKDKNASTTTGQDGPNLTDMGNAERFAALHKGKTHYVHPWRTWITWDGIRWEPDRKLQHLELAKNAVRNLYQEASETEDPESRKKIAAWARTCEASQKLHSMIDLARSHPALAILPDDLDADPWLLTVANGTIDLHTGSIRPTNPADLITKLAPTVHDDAAKAPRWQQFIEEITLGDVELAAYVQRTIGYCLTGSIREQVFFILHGPGANGKSTLTETLRSVLGDYAVHAASTTFLLGRKEATPSDIMRTAGARVVTTAEAPGGASFDESLLKQVTGGDPVVGRKRYQDEDELRPVFKLLISVNTLPKIHGSDEGIWRRVHRIPFDAHFPEGKRDKDLPGRLLEERSGILNWCLEGCLEWQRKGLAAPAKVAAAIEDYRLDMDRLAEFIAAKCDLSDPNATTTARELYAAYKEFEQNQDREPLSQTAFGRTVASRKGIRKERETRATKAVFYTGIQLANPCQLSLDPSVRTQLDTVGQGFSIGVPIDSAQDKSSGNSVSNCVREPANHVQLPPAGGFDL